MNALRTLIDFQDVVMLPVACKAKQQNNNNAHYFIDLTVSVEITSNHQASSLNH